MSSASKFKRLAARSQTKPAQQEGETPTESEPVKPVKPAPANSFNPLSHPVAKMPPITRQQARRGSTRGK